MGRNIPRFVEDEKAVNVLFNVVLDNRTMKKPDLVQAILGALNAAGCKQKYKKMNVERFLLNAVEHRQDLVRPLISKAKRQYRTALDLDQKTREYRIEAGYKRYMSSATAAKWDRQLQDAKDAAAAWDQKYENHAKETAAARRAAGINNLAKMHERRRQKKGAAAAALQPSSQNQHVADGAAASPAQLEPKPVQSPCAGAPGAPAAAAQPPVAQDIAVH